MVINYHMNIDRTNLGDSQAKPGLMTKSYMLNKNSSLHIMVF
jgi:hypothetical protein